MTQADVVIPTHDHAPLLAISARSVLAQTVADLRLHIVGDGVGDDTRTVVGELLADDDRVRFHDLPKAGRTGEPHRHPIVSTSDASIVTYLGDDDLMLPDHVEQMLEALAEADLAFPPPAILTLTGGFRCLLHSFEQPYWRDQALGGKSLFSLSGMSHTTAAYRRLPHGWRTTPDGYFTDQYMVLQFLEQPWCRFGHGDWPTVVRLPSTARGEMPAEDRRDELAQMWRRISEPQELQAMRRAFYAAARERGARAEIELDELRAERRQ